MKLSKLVNLFNTKSNAVDSDAYARDAQFLCQQLKHIFPQGQAVEQAIVDMKFEGIRPNDVYTVEYLPFHTRDHDWLTNYIANLNPEIEFLNIKKFVLGSTTFDTARSQYEQDLTKAQIQYMLNSDIPNGIMSVGYNQDKIKHLDNYDQVFRAGVVDAMNFLGVDPHSIDVGLELNADAWRKQTMVQAFLNRYYLHTPIDHDNLKQEHQDNWVRLREYEYYQDHQPIIDELGTATENMQLGDEQARDLAERVKKFHDQRMEFVRSVMPLHLVNQHTINDIEPVQEL